MHLTLLSLDNPNGVQILTDAIQSKYSLISSSQINDKFKIDFTKFY